MFKNTWDVIQYVEPAEFRTSLAAEITDVIDQYIYGFNLNSEEREWTSTRLVSTLSVDPTKRPTASELKSVFHTMLNAIPEGQRHSRSIG